MAPTPSARRQAVAERLAYFFARGGELRQPPGAGLWQARVGAGARSPEETLICLEAADLSELEEIRGLLRLAQFELRAPRRERRRWVQVLSGQRPAARFIELILPYLPYLSPLLEPPAPTAPPRSAGRVRPRQPVISAPSPSPGPAPRARPGVDPPGLLGLEELQQLLEDALG